MHWIARAPASSANLGPGFDTLAIALGLYVEVELEDRAQGLLVEATGEGAELPRGASHLAAQVVCKILGHDRVAIRVHSDIPVARGLGSSAALVVAAAAAAVASSGPSTGPSTGPSPVRGTGASTVRGIGPSTLRRTGPSRLPEDSDGVGQDSDIASGAAEEAFRWGAAFDGHAENAAAAARGGLVAATFVEDQPVARRLPLDPELSFVVVVPAHRLSTSAARGLLPRSLPYEDAVFNLGRFGLLLAGLADHTKLLATAGDDRLHQPARSALFVEAPALLDGLREVGALTSCWSGAGPSILAICTEQSASLVAEEARSLMVRVGLDGAVLALRPDLQGAQVQPV